MASNTGVIIKRSFQTAIPGELEPGELAYSYVSNVMFIGSATGDGVLNIGGYYYTETLDAATPDNVANTLVRRDANGNFQGVLVGNANTADRLSNARSFSISGGDISASNVQFDGTSNVRLNASLNTINGLTPGYYGGLASVPVIQVAANGRIMSVANSTSSSSFTVEGNTGSSLFAGGKLRFEGGSPGITTVESSNGSNTVVTFKLDNAVITPANLVNGSYRVSLDSVGALNLAHNGTVRNAPGGPVNLVSDQFVQLQWTTGVNDPDPNGTANTSNWAYVSSGGFAIENQTSTANAKGWYFNNDGSLTAAGNITAPGVVSAQTISVIGSTDNDPRLSFVNNKAITAGQDYITVSANTLYDYNGFFVQEGINAQAVTYTEGDILLIANSSGTISPNWKFGKDANTTFPGGATIGDAYHDGGTSLRAASGQYAILASNNLQQYIQVDNNNIYFGTNYAPGVPTGLDNFNGQGGWNQNFYSNLATTGGTGTGLTVDVAAGGGGYISINQISINNPGSGYTNGDVITITNEYDLSSTFTVVVGGVHEWTFSPSGNTTFPGGATVSNNSVITASTLVGVHADTTGNQQVFLQGDGVFVQTYDGTNYRTFQHDTAGRFVLPGGSTLDDVSDVFSFYIKPSNPNQTLKLYSSDNNIGVDVQSTALFISTNRNISAHYWSFDADGYLNFPDSTAQFTAFTGTAIDQVARDAANNASSGSAIDQAARTKANTASSNTIYTQGVDTAQNTRINAAFSAANTAAANTVITQGVDATQNAAITVLQGVNLTQNTRITSADDLARSAFNNSNAAFTQANVGATFVNTGGTVSGNVTITKDLAVTGNLYILGNTTTINTSTFAVQDTMIVLGIGNYTTDVLDIGFAGHYNNGVNAHAGIIRDASLKEFFVFDGYTPELSANNNIDPSDPSFNKANVVAGIFKGNLIGTSATVNGLSLYNYVTSGYGKANSASVLAQAAFDSANTAGANTVYLQGVDNTQNTNITAVNTYATSGYAKANSANVLAQAAFDKANNAAAASFDQYARDTANSASSNTVVIQGVDLTQNTNITAVNTYATSAYGKANSANVLAQAAFDAANTAAANTVYQQGVNNTQNTNITAVNTYATSGYGKANSANVLAQAAFDVANTASANTVYTQGVDATQNTNITAVNTYATSAYGKANSANVLAQASFDVANTASANTVYTQSVDATQNTRIGSADNLATSAFNKANSANVLAQAAFDKANTDNTLGQAAFDAANTAIANTVYTQGVDATQNTNITAVNTFAGSAYAKANSANVIAQASFDAANTVATNILYVLGVDATQNTNITAVNTYAGSAYNQANVSTTLAQAAFDRANTDNTLGQAAFDKANSANVLAQSAYDTANTKLNITGGTVTGNISFTGANVALGNIANLHIYGGNTGQLLTTDNFGNLSFIDLPTPNTVTYTANSLIQTNGVYVSGNLWSTQVFGDYASSNGAYVLTDGSGSAPAWYIDFDFINVVKFNRVVLNINYTQASGHTVYIQLYNNTSSGWDNIGTYTGLGSYYAFALEVIDEAAYLNAGQVRLRLYHSNQGNVSHQTSIDYVALEQSYQGPQGPRGPTGATGATGATGNGVSSGGTTGQVLIKNSSTNYDTSWSNNLIDSYNTANAAFVAANASIVLGQAAFDKVNIASSNTIYTQGVDATQNTNITAVNTYATSGYDQANAAITLATNAYGAANTAAANTVYQQGVNSTQNTNITAVNTYAGSGYNQANVATTLTQAGFDFANTVAANTVYTQGVDLTQNTNITAVNTFAGSGYNQANAANVLAQAAFNKANSAASASFDQYARDTANSATSNTIVTQGVDATQNAQITVIQGVDNTQNTRISSADDLARSAFGQANAAFDQANVGVTFINTGGTVSGNVSFTKDVTITGNLNILGNSTVIHTSQIDVYDSLIYLANNNFTSDAVDIGIIGHYKGPSVGEHAGIFRDPNLKEWIFFKGYTPEVQSNNLIDINDASFQQANVYAAYVKGNLIATNVVVNGLDLYNYVTNAYGKANTVGTLAQAAFDAANNAAASSFDQYARNTANSASSNTVITQGVDATQNTNITAVNTYATSGYGQANAAVTLATNAYTAANSAGANTVYLQGVNTTQNSRITSADGLARSAYGQANNSLPLTGGVINGNVVADTLQALNSVNTPIIQRLIGGDPYSPRIEFDSNTGVVYVSGTTGPIRNEFLRTGHIRLNTYAPIIMSGTSDGSQLVLNNTPSINSLYADIFSIKTSTTGTANNTWSFSNNRLIFPDSTQQNTAFTGTAIDNFSRDKANSANVLAQASFDKANSVNILAQAAFDKANTGTTSSIDQYARDTANTASANTIISQGVDVTQNNSIIFLTAYTQAAFDKANTGTSSSSDQVARDTANAAYNKANAANVLAQAAFDAANTGGGGGGTLDQYARTTANGATVTAQAAFDRANTGVAAPVQVDDLSFQFDGTKRVFTLTTDGVSLSPSNPNNLQIFVGGIQVFPTKYAYDYFNLPEISVFNSGFKLSGNTITFATAPSKNMNFYGLSRSELIGTFKYKQTPFSALNIMLGS